MKLIKPFNIFTFLLFFILFSCSNLLLETNKISTGGIYGLFLWGRNDLNDFSKVQLQVDGTGLKTKPDSSGIFYFSEIKPGTYNISAKAEGFTDLNLQKIVVVSDSISIVTMQIQHKGKSAINEQWDGIKIKRINIQKKGGIKGKIKDSITDKTIANVAVVVKGTFWGTNSDSLGNYEIRNIIPGVYKVLGKEQFHHDSLVYDVHVVPDSSSVVNLWLTNNTIPESPSPVSWLGILDKY